MVAVALQLSQHNSIPVCEVVFRGELGVCYVRFPPLRPTATGPLKYKNRTQKFVHFRGNYFCIFFFVCAPLWAGQVNEKKYKNETEVRGILAIQVSSPLLIINSLKFENEAHLGHMSSSEAGFV